MPSDPLTNDPETLIQASIKRSISDSVVLGPRLTRTAACASCAGTPMAESTCEGWTLPDEQAAPEEILTSGTVYGTVVGSGLEFEMRGAHELRGVPGPWPIFALQR